MFAFVYQYQQSMQSQSKSIWYTLSVLKNRPVSTIVWISHDTLGDTDVHFSEVSIYFFYCYTVCVCVPTQLCSAHTCMQCWKIGFECLLLFSILCFETVSHSVFQLDWQAGGSQDVSDSYWRFIVLKVWYPNNLTKEANIPLHQSCCFNPETRES